MSQLRAGDTLYLRGGTYYENVYLGLAGTKDAPITMRSYPGELAVVDGGLREFFEKPAECWQPFPEGGPDEYRSTRAYQNHRDMLGAFGDSMIALHTYWHSKDLRATNELWVDKGDENLDPLYCGPGLWYDKATGYLHARLSHTRLQSLGDRNYTGETDPRKIPLVIAPFQSTPLVVDNARHVRLQDLIIRGGGYYTVRLKQAAHVEFDNITIYSGTYGLSASGTGPLRFVHSAIYGMTPPWAFRSELGLMLHPNKPHRRDITRLIAHALVVAEGEEEYSVVYYPLNQQWEIAHSEFTDGTDGLYLGGVNDLRFHHNRVENMIDDGIYLSSMRDGTRAQMRLYQNRIARCLTAFALGGRHQSDDTVHLYRNIVDQRDPIQLQRPTPENRNGTMGFGNLIGDHGSPDWASLFVYHNTFIAAEQPRRWAQWMVNATSEKRPRRVFNNIFVQPRLPAAFAPLPAQSHDVQMDGNLYAETGGGTEKNNPLDAFRGSPAFVESQKKYPPGWEANSLVANPSLLPDLHLAESSAARGKGVRLPAEWEDPLRAAGDAPPDIGALPFGGEPFAAGRNTSLDPHLANGRKP